MRLIPAPMKRAVITLSIALTIAAVGTYLLR
jgi:hypothetical protein